MQIQVDQLREQKREKEQKIDDLRRLIEIVAEQNIEEIPKPSSSNWQGRKQRLNSRNSNISTGDSEKEEAKLMHHHHRLDHHTAADTDKY